MSIINEILSDIFEDDEENPTASTGTGGGSSEVTNLDDDRHFCKECKKFSVSRSYCFATQCNIIDDIPRRCADFFAH